MLKQAAHGLTWFTRETEFVLVNVMSSPEGKDREPPIVLDGPFAETKEQLLGFFVIECADLDEAVETAKDLGRANPGGAYEIRPMALLRPGSLPA